MSFGQGTELVFRHESGTGFMYMLGESGELNTHWKVHHLIVSNPTGVVGDYSFFNTALTAIILVVTVPANDTVSLVFPEGLILKEGLMLFSAAEVSFTSVTGRQLK